MPSVEKTLYYTHHEIEISFKFIPKILMSKECINFFGPLCIYTHVHTCIYKFCVVFQHTLGGNCKTCYAVGCNDARQHFPDKSISLSLCFVVLSQFCHLMSRALLEVSPRPTYIHVYYINAKFVDYDCLFTCHTTHCRCHTQFINAVTTN